MPERLRHVLRTGPVRGHAGRARRRWPPDGCGRTTPRTRGPSAAGSPPTGAFRHLGEPPAGRAGRRPRPWTTATCSWPARNTGDPRLAGAHRSRRALAAPGGCRRRAWSRSAPSRPRGADWPVGVLDVAAAGLAAAVVAGLRDPAAELLAAVPTSAAPPPRPAAGAAGARRLALWLGYLGAAHLWAPEMAWPIGPAVALMATGCAVAVWAPRTARRGGRSRCTAGLGGTRPSGGRPRPGSTHRCCSHSSTTRGS